MTFQSVVDETGRTLFLSQSAGCTQRSSARCNLHLDEDSVLAEFVARLKRLSSHPACFPKKLSGSCEMEVLPDNESVDILCRATPIVEWRRALAQAAGKDLQKKSLRHLIAAPAMTIDKSVQRFNDLDASCQ